MTDPSGKAIAGEMHGNVAVFDARDLIVDEEDLRDVQYYDQETGISFTHKSNYEVERGKEGEIYVAMKFGKLVFPDYSFFVRYEFTDNSISDWDLRYKNIIESPQIYQVYKDEKKKIEDFTRHSVWINIPENGSDVITTYDAFIKGDKVIIFHTPIVALKNEDGVLEMDYVYEEILNSIQFGKEK